jgi:hypothetical protein
MATLADALTAYRICAKAEGKSYKTVDWVCDTVRYFSEFLGDQSIDRLSADAQCLRRFILSSG